MADGRVHQGRGEAVDRRAERRAGHADLPAPQHGEHGRGRPGEADGQQHGQADLRPEQQRHRRQQDPGQQQGRVPHEVHALRRVHGRGDQGRQMEVRDGRGVVAEEPGELVGVVGVARDRPRHRVPPQPQRDRERRQQVVHGGQRHRPAAAQRARLLLSAPGPGRPSTLLSRREPKRSEPGRAGHPARRQQIAIFTGQLGLRLGLAVDGTAVGRAGLVLARHPLADRVEDGQALADQAGGDLAEAVGAVEHADVRAGQPAPRPP